MMKTNYPADGMVSVWIGTLLPEDNLELHVDEDIAPVLALDTDMADICEVGFEPETVPVRDLLAGFSGASTFLESALAAAAAQGIVTANAAVVCYDLACEDPPAEWGELQFLGSFPGRDGT